MQAGNGIPDGVQASQDEEGPTGALYPCGILRKKLYDQNLSDWSARYKKNKQNLDALAKDCDILRQDVGKTQRDVEERADGYKQLEAQFENVVMVKYQETKAAYEAAVQQKQNLTLNISELKKNKNQLTREKKTLTNDHERKHVEMMRMAEVHDKLDGQQSHLAQQL